MSTPPPFDVEMWTIYLAVTFLPLNGMQKAVLGCLIDHANPTTGPAVILLRNSSHSNLVSLSAALSVPSPACCSLLTSVVFVARSRATSTEIGWSRSSTPSMNIRRVETG